MCISIYTYMIQSNSRYQGFQTRNSLEKLMEKMVHHRVRKRENDFGSVGFKSSQPCFVSHSVTLSWNLSSLLNFMISNSFTIKMFVLATFFKAIKVIITFLFCLILRKHFQISYGITITSVSFIVYLLIYLAIWSYPLNLALGI